MQIDDDRAHPDPLKMLGLPHGQNYLVDYCAEWPQLYQSEKARIEAVAGEHVQTIEHVGSTAVPGLSAKPIIDIALGVADLSAADALIRPMATIGYDYPGDIGIPDHRIFGRDRDVRRYLVHVLELNGYRWRELIAFLDVLRTDPARSAEYQRLKLESAARFPSVRSAYTESKARFIRRTLDRR